MRISRRFSAAFPPLFRQLAREKPRHRNTMPAFFAGDLTKNRRELPAP
jgi:hypothetical protein